MFYSLKPWSTYFLISRTQWPQNQFIAQAMISSLQCYFVSSQLLLTSLFARPPLISKAAGVQRASELTVFTQRGTKDPCVYNYSQFTQLTALHFTSKPLLLHILKLKENITL